LILWQKVIRITFASILPVKLQTLAFSELVLAIILQGSLAEGRGSIQLTS